MHNRSSKKLQKIEDTGEGKKLLISEYSLIFIFLGIGIVALHLYFSEYYVAEVILKL